LDAAFWEFSEDTTRQVHTKQNIGNNSWIRFLAAEEKLVGDYRFGTYDLLVLPPSFPYGGMVRILFNVRRAKLEPLLLGKCLFVLPKPK
jgi:hypothetical protein